MVIGYKQTNISDFMCGFRLAAHVIYSVSSMICVIRTQPLPLCPVSTLSGSNVPSHFGILLSPSIKTGYEKKY